jgi:hypothetical protein
MWHGWINNKHWKNYNDNWELKHSKNLSWSWPRLEPASPWWSITAGVSLITTTQPQVHHKHYRRKEKKKKKKKMNGYKKGSEQTVIQTQTTLFTVKCCTTLQQTTCILLNSLSFSTDICLMTLVHAVMLSQKYYFGTQQNQFFTYDYENYSMIWVLVGLCGHVSDCLNCWQMYYNHVAQ